MPAFPIPAALKLFSGGVLFGGFWSPPEDYVAPNLGFGARVGLVTETAPFEMELTILGGRSTLRNAAPELSSSVTRVDALFKLYDGDRLHVVAGPGVGWRYVQVGGGLVDSEIALRDFGLGTGPYFDLVFAAGGGIRYSVTGPLSVRADVQGLVQVGDQPESEPLHAWPALLASVALDLRYAPPPDRDDDGVPDTKDRCPDSLEDFDYFDDADGCLDPDDDHDGVADVRDQCKDQPEDRDGYRDEDGCSDHNNDGDAFPDVHDRCPNEAETRNGWEEGDGCADAVPADLVAFLGTRSDIAFSGASLTAESVPPLEALAALFGRYPHMRLWVGVYTDSALGNAGARELTRAQAVALHSWLVAHGVGPERLVMVAGGDGVPLEAKRTDADALTNRRVVLSLHDPVGFDGARVVLDPTPPDRW